MDTLSPQQSTGSPGRLMRRHPWRRRTIAAVAVAAGIAGVIAWTFRPQPVAADLVPAARGDMLITVEDEGETRIHDVYVVSAPVAGRIQRIALEAGDRVIAGETVLALFEPADPALYDARARTEAEAGLATAAADVARARAEVQFAEGDLRRSEALRKDETIAQVTLDRARLAAAAAKAALDQAQAVAAKRRADLATARAAITRGESGVVQVPVRAPVSGRVLKRIQQSETVLTAGTPILEIGDPAKLEIVTDLLSAEAVRVHEEDSVIIEDWGGAAPLAGRVRRVEPFGFTKISALGIEEQRVNVIIDFSSPPSAWAALGHGYRVLTRIVIEERKNVVKLPLSALFRAGTDWAAFVSADGRAAERKLTIGARNATEAEITNGVSAGEQVIVHPSDRIAAGTRIAPRR